MMKRLFALLSTVCALCLVITMAPFHPLMAEASELPELQGEIIVDGIIHPGNEIHARFRFLNGELIEFRQSWTVADNRELTQGTFTFDNYGSFTIPESWDDKYLSCEITLDGYNGTIRSGTFHSTHPYWLGSWVTTETEHAIKCHYCDKQFLREPHTFGTATMTSKPSCTEAGEAIATCSICKYESSVALAPLGHDWDDPIYEWNDARSSCVATRSCNRDSSHLESCKGHITSRVTKPAGYGIKGETTYTATFESNWAHEQNVTVANIEALNKPGQGGGSQNDNAPGIDSTPKAPDATHDSNDVNKDQTLPQTADPACFLISALGLSVMCFTLGSLKKSR